MGNQSPEACSGMDEIRAEIDQRDREVIRLLGERYRYVQAAVAFKTDERAVRAPERQAAMLSERRQWAADEGLDPDLVESLFRQLVEHFIGREMADWRRHQ